MTPAQIEQAIRERYNAVGDTFFNSNLVLDIIYQGCLELANEAFVIERKYTASSVSGTRAYTYPTSAIAIRRVEYNGKKLYPVTVDEDPKTSTTEVSGTPSQYSLWNNEIILFPTPSASSDEIAIYSYNEPAAITSSSTLEIPTEYHMMLVDLGLSIFYAKDGDFPAANYHRNLWNSHVARVKRTRAKKKRGDRFMVVTDANESAWPYGDC